MYKEFMKGKFVVKTGRKETAEVFLMLLHLA